MVGERGQRDERAERTFLLAQRLRLCRRWVQSLVGEQKKRGRGWLPSGQWGSKLECDPLRGGGICRAAPQRSFTYGSSVPAAPSWLPQHPKEARPLPIHKNARNITWNLGAPGRGPGRCSQESLETEGRGADWGGASLEARDQGLGKQARWDMAGGGLPGEVAPTRPWRSPGLEAVAEAGRPEEGPFP